MNILENLKYSADHEWVKLEGDIATVGITDFAQTELGDIVFVDVTTEGETFQAGEVFGSIEAVKTVSDLMMPIAGEIVEFNADLEADAAAINSDPYGKGWIVKVKVSNAAEINALMDAAAYKASVGV